MAALLFALAVGGCGGDEGGGEAELTVSAASSLAEAFEAYGETTDVDEKFSFAGSDGLAAQIRNGAPVDVFAAANTSLPLTLHAEGLVDKPVTFISNRLVLGVPVNSDIETFMDVLEPDVDLVIGAEGIPVGDYARGYLANLLGEEARFLLARVRSEESDSKSIVAKLTVGAADAGFVFESDVRSAEGELEAIKLPLRKDTLASYGAAVVSDSENPEAARAFVDGLVKGAGRDALLDAGFLEPRGE